MDLKIHISFSFVKKKEIYKFIKIKFRVEIYKTEENLEKER